MSNLYDTRHRDPYDSKLPSSPVTVARMAGAVLLVALVTEGCVAIPVPQFPDEHETYISAENIDLVESDSTERAEVRDRLGDPKYRFDDDSLWIYEAESHRAGKLRVCGAVVHSTDIERSPDGSVGEAGCSKRTEERVMTYLVVTFDERGTVSRRLTSSVKPGKCARSHICRSEGGDLFYRADNGEWVAPRPVFSPTGEVSRVIPRQ